MENDKLVVELAGRISADNAGAVESELTQLVQDKGVDALVLDASGLEYISSAGLRVLLKLRRRLSAMEVRDVSPEVYDVFDMTGFTQLIDVKKRLREISVEGCELIGRGGNGAVWRLDEETIVKQYFGATITLEQIQNSRTSAQKLLAMGIPVAIAFDVVRVEDGYGLVFELLDCKTVGQLIHEDPSCTAHWAHEAAMLLRQLHSTEAPTGTFPDARDTCHGWVRTAKEALSEDVQERLHRMYDAMPAKNTLVHGDFHTGNMMVQNGEIVLIDTDDVALGDPVVDMAGMALTFEFIGTEEQAMLTMGMSVEEMKHYYDLFLKEYYGTDDPALLQQYAYQRKLHSLVKLLYGLCKTDRIPAEVKAQVIPQMRDGLVQLMDALGI